MNKNIMTFDSWAILNKDEGMEKGHHAPVKHMLKLIFEYHQKNNQKYSAIDIGCGNGWVIRKFNNHSLCTMAHGIDGAENMIKKARAANPDGLYFNEDITKWDSKYQYDIVFSMETLYYFKNPIEIINKIYDNVLKENGMFVMGIDHYSENAESLDWGKKFNLDITTLSIENWVSLFENSGFQNVTYKQVESKKDWNGTLIITGYKK